MPQRGVHNMPRHDDVPKHSSNKFYSQFKASYRSRRVFLLAGVTFSALLTLACACGLIGSDPRLASGRIVIRRTLPTLTRTPAPNLAPAASAPEQEVAIVPQATPANPGPAVAPAEAPTSVEIFFIPTFTPVSAVAAGSTEVAAPAEIASGNAPAAPAEVAAVNPSPLAPAAELPPTNTPVPVATEPPAATSTPTEIPPPTPIPEGWAFSGVQVTPKQDGSGLLVHGNLLNNTGNAQELALVTGTFYDEQGQVVADGNTTDYWPVAGIPQGGQVPFELVVPGLTSVANFDLRVDAQPGGTIPRQDFEFFDLNAANTGEDYCVGGKLRNPGEKLASYLVIVAVIYDEQGNVINYYDLYNQSPQDLVGDQTTDFEICVNPLNQQVAHFESLAWGL